MEVTAFTLVRVAFKIGEMVGEGKLPEFESNEELERLALRIAKDYENEIDIQGEEESSPMLYAERKLSKK